MKTRIQKWGNSLGIRLPKSIAEQKALKAGAGVTVSLHNDQIIIEPTKDDRPTLAELLSTITEENKHAEIDWGEAKGKEIW